MYQLKLNKLLRLIVPCLACLSIVLCMATPASAATYAVYNYEDYAESVEYEQDKTYVSVSIPVKPRWAVHDQRKGQWIVNGTSQNPLTLSFAEETSVTVRIEPLRGATDGGLLDLRNVPNGSYVFINFNTFATLDTYESVTCEVQYLNSSYGVISSVNYTAESVTYGGITYYLAINKPDGAVYANFIGRMNEMSVPVGDLTLTVGDFKLLMEFDALVYESMQNGKTNKLLEQIYNGSQEGQDSADDLQNSMDELTPGINDDLDSIGSLEQPDISDIDTDMGALIGQQGMTQSNNILSILMGMPLVATQFIVACTIMLIAFVLYGKR